VKIVAELSANHLGSFERALDLVKAASTPGADAVNSRPSHQRQMVELGRIIKSGPWRAETLWSLYREAHTPSAWHGPLFTSARYLGLEPLIGVSP